MGYVVVESFSDMQDGGYTYNPGDMFPRCGVSVSNGRILELSTSRNKLGRALIQKMKVETAAPVSGTEVAAEADESIKAVDVAVNEPPQDPSESKPRRGRRKKN